MQPCSADMPRVLAAQLPSRGAVRQGHSRLGWKCAEPASWAALPLAAYPFPRPWPCLLRRRGVPRSASPGRREVLNKVLDLGLQGLLALSTVALFFIWAGSTAFQRGLVELSVQLFDAASSVGYPSALLWQRGISLYYAGRYEDGAAQFRKDADVNSSDTEEAVWAMLCEAQTFGFASAQQRMMRVGKDPRSIMRLVSELFEGAVDAKRQLEAMASVSPGDKDSFYSALYLGLFDESQGHDDTSLQWIRRSLDTRYAEGSFDYMVDAQRDSAQRLRAGARRLEDSRRTALEAFVALGEAESIGMDVMSELTDQRDALKRTKGHLHDVDDHLGTSKMFLSTMSRRIQGNQAMLWCLAIVLFIILVFLIYLKLQKLVAAFSAAGVRAFSTVLRMAESWRIAAKAEELEDLGGLKAITDSWLCANGVTLLPARSRALTAAKAALHPKKKAFRLGRRGVMFLEAQDAEVFQRRRPGRQCRQLEITDQVLERRRPHRRVNRNKKESRPLNGLPQRIEEEETDAELGRFDVRPSKYSECLRRSNETKVRDDEDMLYSEEDEYGDEFDEEEGDYMELDGPPPEVLDGWEKDEMAMALLANFQSEEFEGKKVMSFRDVAMLLEVLGLEREQFVAIFSGQGGMEDEFDDDFLDEEEEMMLKKQFERGYGGGGPGGGSRGRGGGGGGGGRGRQNHGGGGRGGGGGGRGRGRRP
ncbi:VTI13 [Symbiodinium sp. KB8]|nr:VTI13 [Symbiodinium sp. KB8]